MVEIEYDGPDGVHALTGHALKRGRQWVPDDVARPLIENGAARPIVERPRPRSVARMEDSEKKES